MNNLTPEAMEQVAQREQVQLENDLKFHTEIALENDSEQVAQTFFFPCSEFLTFLTGNLETQTMDSMIFRRFFHVMNFILAFGGESFGEGVSLLDDLWFPTFVPKLTGLDHAERLQCPAKVGQKAS